MGERILTLKAIRKLYKQQSGLVIAGVLLAMIAAVLLLPALKPLRSIEFKPENEGLVLASGASLVSDVRAPAGRVSYWLAWVQDGPGSPRLVASDYKTVTLEVKTAQGQVVRTAARPLRILKDDATALLFNFDVLQTTGSDHLIFTLRQAGTGSVMLRHPVADNIKPGEAAPLAFQLGEHKNWLTLLVEKVYAEDLTRKDIASYLQRGKQIMHGENPYACVLRADPCVGYPAHLPGMYLVAAGLVAMGVKSLAAWAAIWRPLAFAAWLGVGLILFIYIYRRRQPALAVAALGFWLFNRWSIDVLRIAHTDFLGVLFLLLAVIFAFRRPKLAAFLFGVSLAIKQLAILAVPIFLIAVWRQKKLRPAALLVLTGLVLLMPLLVVLPFFVNNPAATVQGLLFVVERPAQAVHGFAPALDEWLDVTGVGKALLMLVLIGAVYVAVWLRSVGLIGGMLMVMAIMMGLTSVLYNQYFIWFIAFIPLAVAEMRQANKNNF